MAYKKRKKLFIIAQCTLLCAMLLALFTYHGHFMRSFHQAALRLGPTPLTCNVPNANDTTCQALHARGCARRFAVVGNGPITEAQRQEINTQYDAVLRFNSLHNWYAEPQCGVVHSGYIAQHKHRVCGDALTVWILEHHASSTKAPPKVTPTAKNNPQHTEAPPYRGLGQLPLCSTKRAGKAARNVWLIGGNNGTRDELVREYPWMRTTPSIVLGVEQWRALYSRVVSDGIPTVGWIGMMVALSCAPRGVGSVDLYGFNWKAQGQEVFRHNLLAERSFADVLDGAGHVTIHGTPCSHQRMCRGCIISPTNDSSCVETVLHAKGDTSRDALLRTSQAAGDAEVESVEVRALQELEYITGGE